MMQMDVARSVRNSLITVRSFAQNDWPIMFDKFIILSSPPSTVLKIKEESSQAYM